MFAFVHIGTQLLGAVYLRSFNKVYDADHNVLILTNKQLRTHKIGPRYTAMLNSMSLSCVSCIRSVRVGLH